MSLPHVPYSAQTAPFMSWLDDTFAAVAALAIVPCGQATGTNTLALTPTTTPATPTITSYANYQVFSFIALNTSSGPVTVNVNGIGALNLYVSGGALQAGAGDIVAGNLYTIVFNLALNAGTGGFAVVSGSGSKLVQRAVTMTSTYSISPTASIVIAQAASPADGPPVLGPFFFTPKSASSNILVRAMACVTPLSGSQAALVRTFVTQGSAVVAVANVAMISINATQTPVLEGNFTIANTSTLGFSLRSSIAIATPGQVAFNGNLQQGFSTAVSQMIVEEWTPGT